MNSIENSLPETFYKELGYAVKNAAPDDLVSQNLFLVVHIAKDYIEQGANYGFSFMDIIQEGMDGLVSANNSYRKDYENRVKEAKEKNMTFANFATTAIRGYITNAFKRKGNIVHIPANHLADSLKKFKEQEKEAKENNEDTSTLVADTHIDYHYIDADEYDQLGTTDDLDSSMADMLNLVDTYGRKYLDPIHFEAICIFLGIGKYSDETCNGSYRKMVSKLKKQSNWLDLPKKLDAAMGEQIINEAVAVLKEKIGRVKD